MSQVDYWLTSAEHDLDTAQGLWQIKKFDWCLFLGHLVLEKTFKAMCAKKHDETPPRTHNLLLLAEKSGIALDNNQKLFLEKVNDFNMESRYPDEKLSFYKLCTEAFTREYFDKIKEFYSWLRQEMKL
jgi:HEPN domain-containing protein